MLAKFQQVQTLIGESSTNGHGLPKDSSVNESFALPKGKQIQDRGLISILKQLHEDLDAAVFDAYGWSPNLTDEEPLEKLVALNHQRAAEEKAGIIKHLRPRLPNPPPQNNAGVPPPPPRNAGIPPPDPRFMFRPSYFPRCSPPRSLKSLCRPAAAAALPTMQLPAARRTFRVIVIKAPASEENAPSSPPSFLR